MSDPAPVRGVLFDLDGTLVQTRVASWEVFEQINDRFSLGVDRPEQYFDLFRGNLFASIRALCRDDAHASEVTAAFLTLLRSDYTPPMVPGMPDVVRRLAADCALAVMSSNAMAVLRRVLTTNGLAYCFGHVFGGDVTPDKRTAISRFLADPGRAFGRRCSADYDEGAPMTPADPSTTVLVTDTAGDVRDARSAGIRAIGVSWGMHGVDDLVEAGAEFVALWPQELPAYMLGAAAAIEPTGACAIPGAMPAEPPCDTCRCGGACATPPLGATPYGTNGVFVSSSGANGAFGPNSEAPRGESPRGEASVAERAQRAGEARRARRRAADPMPAPSPTPRPARSGDDEVLAALRLLARGRTSR